jgi:hypothetical protein
MGVATKREKRSPIKQKPLRSPGESLAEERDRILEEQLIPPAMTAAFAAVFAGVEWWRWLNQAPPQPFAFSLGAVAVVAFFVYRLLRARPRLHAVRLGLDGERAVGQYLEANRDSDWHVFHDIPGPGFNIDHVVISPRGVFAIETKTFSKPMRGQAIVNYDGEKVLVDGFAPERDPIVQARAARDWIRDLLLDTTGIRYPVRGVVVFPGWWVESQKTGKRPDVWVLNEKAFVKWVANEIVVIKSEDAALAASRLVNYVTR